MRSGGMVTAGIALFVLGLLLRSGLVASPINAIGVLAMVAGLVVFAFGVWRLVRGRR